MNELTGNPTRESPSAQKVLALLVELAHELHPSLGERDFGLDDSLEADFALDSLARVEMLMRIERALGVKLDERAAFDAATPRDLLRLLQGAPLAAATAVPSAAVPTPRAGGVRTPPDALTSFVAVFAWQVEHHADVPVLTLLPAEGEPALAPLTFGDLWRDAQATAAGLRERGVAEGDAVAIMLPTGRDFFAAFYGSWLAGAVPVPLYPPARPSQLEDHLGRVAGVLANAQARVLLTVDRARPLAQFLRGRAPTLQAVATVAEVSIPGGALPSVGHAGDTTALLQYTSGSTGDPKGVVLSHANLIASLRAMWRASGITPADVFVSWLPLYHDMGLIGACLGSLYVGFPLMLMPPLAFLTRPVRWLQAIDRYRGTISAGPNFAYELAVNKIDDADLADLDLSCWRLAFNGAEPVSAITLERFSARFGRCGFRASALMPVYGLAEASLGVTFPPPGRGPLIDRVDRQALMREGRAALARPDDPSPLLVVSNGLPLPGHEVRIVDEMGLEVAERTQGRVEFRGLAATVGYFDNPSATRKLWHGTWLVSGDLGYLAGGELYLTGREKDLIIRRGFNLHPQELEAAVAELPGVRKGGVVVFPASDPGGGTERLVIVAETRVRERDERERLQAEIGRLASELLGVPADDIMLAPPRTVLKTSSGKLRRAACRDLYERGFLGREPRSVRRQMARLAVQTARARARQFATRAAGMGWSAWAWLVFIGFGVLAWIAVLVLPTPLHRRRLVWRMDRAGWGLLGVKIRLRGIDVLPTGQCVVVANHSSYADAVLLAAVLPARFVFTAKEELARTPVIGWPLRRIDTAFVARGGDARSIEDARALTERLERGESLIFFPEGTFQRTRGLLPFRLGAFASAAAAHIPIVPVAIYGTRSLLPPERCQAQRRDVEVIVGTPLEPTGDSWKDVLALRDRARSALLQLTGEPDLGAELITPLRQGGAGVLSA
jgi:1-acyl-sn-glycerol-3-phosphate acyltransferase